jgi:uncharacterized protein YjiS (DUF1127 family)
MAPGPLGKTNAETPWATHHFLELFTMIRLTELSGTVAGSTAERWDQRSVDVLSIVQTARTLRAEFIADHLHSALEAFGRWSGLRALFVALRRRLQHRRTLKALTQLDDRLLRDIGVSRAEIDATAAFCCEDKAAATPSVWQRLSAWLSQERRRRQTVRELSAMPDELLADVGIERAEIPAVAAALVSGQPVTTASGETVEVAGDMPVAAPVTAEVLAFIEVRRGAQRSANQNHADRPAA